MKKSNLFLGIATAILVLSSVVTLGTPRETQAQCGYPCWVCFPPTATYPSCHNHDGMPGSNGYTHCVSDAWGCDGYGGYHDCDGGCPQGGGGGEGGGPEPE